MREGIDAEKAVLGAILLNSDSFFQCGILKDEDFFLSSHRIIYRAMAELAKTARAIDLVTLADKLGADLPKVGDAGYISSLIDGVPDSPHIEQYVQMVYESSRRRRLLALAKGIIQQCEDGSETTSDCVSLATDRILELAGTTSNKSRWLKDYSEDVYSRVRKAAKTPLSDLPIGLQTGIKGIDHRTTGLRPGELWILASYTGEGKSIFAMQVIVQNLKRAIPILIFTPEMNRRQALSRMIPQLTDGRVKGRHLRDPRHMTAAQLAEFESTQCVIDKWPLLVNDTSSPDIAMVYAHAMAMVKQHKVRLIVVDYLQLVKGRGESRYDKVSDVSNTLRDLAKNSDVPVLAVSQMSRPENREKRIPRIFDLKESGSIEQDAHVIIMPYRPQEKDGRYTGEDVIIIGKQREGPTGSIKVRFDSLTLTFQPKDEDNEYTNDGFF